MEIKKYPAVSSNQLLLNAEILRSLFIYHPETGDFYWREYGPHRHMGKPIGKNNGTGYIQIPFQKDGKPLRFLAHRLAWLYVYGVWPVGGLDHIDRNRTNNRIANLREATISQNNRNRSKRSRKGRGKKYTSQFVGVCWHKASKKWHAQINRDGKRCSLGTFDSEQDAALAYNQAALKLDAEHCRQNQLA
jgi:hypothetical protein